MAHDSGKSVGLKNGDHELLSLTPARFDLLIEVICHGKVISDEQFFSPETHGYTPAVGSIQPNSSSSVAVDTAMPMPSVEPIIMPQSAPLASTSGPPEKPGATLAEI